MYGTLRNLFIFYSACRSEDIRSYESPCRRIKAPENAQRNLSRLWANVHQIWVILIVVLKLFSIYLCTFCSEDIRAEVAISSKNYQKVGSFGVHI